MSEPSSNNSRAFQTSARSRRRVIKPKKWLTVLLLILLLLIGTALFFVVRYVLKNGLGTKEESSEPVEQTLAQGAPSEEAARLLTEELLGEGLILPDIPAAA